MRSRKPFFVKRQPFFLRREILAFLTLVLLGITSFWVALSFPNKANPNLQTPQVENKLEPTQSQTANIGNNGAIAQPNDTFKKLIGQLRQDAKDTRLTFAVPEQFQSKVLKSVSFKDEKKVIALTFDDGPWQKYTEQILDILKKNKIKATFFMVGQMVEEYPEIARKVVADGHAIANHTWNHWYRKMDEATAASEIERTADIIYKTTGAKTSIFRPPGGFLNNGLVDYAEKKQYFIAMWSSDSIDYRRPPAERLAHNVLKNAKSGGMVLMHDGGGDRTNTVKALPLIIANLKQRGFQFVTVPELLEIQAQEKTAITATKPNPSK